ncbi:MAG: twin-arginine translocation pathway signal protein, partial [Opitutales bacterium]
MNTLPLTRREFLRRSGSIGLLAFNSAVPAFLTQSAYAGAPPPDRDRTILVLIQLAGGNDGLNTVIPYGMPVYH